MNKLKNAVEILFSSPMQDMNYVTYFKYVNEAGKITGRSLLELSTICLTYIDDMEKKMEQYDANFKEIEDILGKLVTSKLEQKIPDLSAGAGDGGKTPEPPLDVPTPIASPSMEAPRVETPQDPLKCEVCNKDFKSLAGLTSHKTTHETK